MSFRNVHLALSYKWSKTSRTTFVNMGILITCIQTNWSENQQLLSESYKLFWFPGYIYVNKYSHTGISLATIGTVGTELASPLLCMSITERYSCRQLEISFECLIKQITRPIVGGFPISLKSRWPKISPNSGNRLNLRNSVSNLLKIVDIQHNKSKFAVVLDDVI